MTEAQDAFWIISNHAGEHDPQVCVNLMSSCRSRAAVIKQKEDKLKDTLKFSLFTQIVMVIKLIQKSIKLQRMQNRSSQVRLLDHTEHVIFPPNVQNKRQ